MGYSLVIFVGLDGSDFVISLGVELGEFGKNIFRCGMVRVGGVVGDGVVFG